MPSRAVLLGCTGWLLLPVVFLATRNAYSTEPGFSIARLRVQHRPTTKQNFTDLHDARAKAEQDLEVATKKVQTKMAELLQKQHELDRISMRLQNEGKGGSNSQDSEGHSPIGAKAKLKQEPDETPQSLPPGITRLKGAGPQLQTSDRLRQYFPNFLFAVYTDKLFRKTRLMSILSTWGTLIDPRSLLIIGDEAAHNVSGSDNHVLATGCQKSSHWEGACCKYAVALYAVHKRMVEEPAIEAAFLFDDDSYLRPAATAEAILRMARQEANTPAMFGIFGCVTKLCHGLCAGAGYGINRKGVMQMTTSSDGISLSQDEFLREQMASCKKCERWADQALTDVAINHKLKLVNYKVHEIHGWALKRKDFKDSVERPREPLLWHYVKSTFQYQFMHNLFQPGPLKTKQCWAVTEADRLQAKLEYEQPGGLCATFRGRTCCLKKHELALTGIMRRLQASSEAPCWYGVYSPDLKLECRCSGAGPLYSSSAALLSGTDKLLDVTVAQGEIEREDSSALSFVGAQPSLQSIIDAQGLSGPWPVALLAERFQCE
mmetsp:Transcript_23365/g.53891  ORF Transcript_23365/g.53891 Transcript_23365/m.53891 type:complete len:546 (-) Transcript_23365:43-1680(-)